MIKKAVFAGMLLLYTAQTLAQGMNFFLVPSEKDTVKNEQPVKKKEEKKEESSTFNLFNFGTGSIEDKVEPEVKPEPLKNYTPTFSMTPEEEAKYGKGSAYDRMIQMGIRNGRAAELNKNPDILKQTFEYNPTTSGEVTDVYMHLLLRRDSEILNTGTLVPPDYYRAMRKVNVKGMTNIQNFYNKNVDPDLIMEFYTIGITNTFTMRSYIGRGVDMDTFKNNKINNRKQLDKAIK